MQTIIRAKLNNIEVSIILNQAKLLKSIFPTIRGAAVPTTREIIKPPSDSCGEVELNSWLEQNNFAC